MFHIASEQDIKDGSVTDVYFQRTVEILRARNIHKHAVAEVRAAHLPEGWDWAVLAGIEEVAHLVSGVDAAVATLAEGTVLRPGDPVLVIEGDYVDYGILETPLLGLLCQASGVATKAARCRIAADGRPVISFGARRMHPALAPMIDRSAYLGGCDGVSVIASARHLGIEPTGTMPHALVLIVGDPVEAFRLFHEVVPASVSRVCLVDTVHDEKYEAVAAAEALGDALQSVRLDTPGSRRGNIIEIAQEVRWELDLRGFRHVKILISGGLDEYEVMELNPVADAYGVGTSISNAPTINFAMDIVEVEGKPCAKRGKHSGRKQVVSCLSCHQRTVVAADHSDRCPSCGGPAQPLLTPLSERGTIVRQLPPVDEIRQSVIDQLTGLTLSGV
ncbi:nicotinate phosphoribosyltransferase [candidate division KD3-62 bacterium DG_56]|uniref:nicotinate phosphoribosyltransferase n=1 Tax=candidate division KD3-62 bacterium DG_56 TaxID=1704032 RepID=A0A0S7XNI1_9BACT|nr:MAG: nicotinate phosphoribosyltransferase [candidate division KD3-62 bacterium DG_56]